MQSTVHVTSVLTLYVLEAAVDVAFINQGLCICVSLRRRFASGQFLPWEDIPYRIAVMLNLLRGMNVKINADHEFLFPGLASWSHCSFLENY